jgi:[CysO sulfur-carrier protein]-S-L-cysteine hydrolase
MARRVRIRRNVFSSLVAQARKNPDVEICGLLSGRNGEILEIFPITNAAEKPAVSYEIGPRELFSSMRNLRRGKLELLGIYHSHPRSANEPSPTDISMAFYPDVAYFIASPREDAEKPVRAFTIRDGAANELEVEIIE